MSKLNIQFQCFIPKSLGKPLINYYQNHPNFNARDLPNYEDFKRKLTSSDVSKYNWILEPGSLHNYFSTDDVDFNEHHSNHTVRLSIQANIDIDKVGGFSAYEKIFKHKDHLDGTNSNRGNQHAGTSHQVKAYIKRLSLEDTAPTKPMYASYFKLREDRSDEDPITSFIKNSKKNSFAEGGNDITIIKLSASAGYPFAEPFSPNIDFELEIELYKNIKSKRIDLNIKGSHNNFPAYELIVGSRVLYNYNPEDYGYSGPDLINLNTSKAFNIVQLLY